MPEETGIPTHASAAWGGASNRVCSSAKRCTGTAARKENL